MNVAFVTASLSRAAGGFHTSVRRLAQSLQAQSAGMTVFSVRDAGTDQDAHAWAPLELSISDSIPPRFLAWAPALLETLLARRPDLVHSHGLWQYPSRATQRWAATTGHPHVISPRGMLDPWALNNNRWKKRLAGALFENRNLRSAACLHALCPAECSAMRAYGLENPICIIPNGIDLPPDRPPAAWPLADLHPALRDHKILFFIGRLHPKKGLPLLLRAWKQILTDSSPARDEWTLLIAGWDQAGHETQLRRQAENLNIADRIVFAGPLHGNDKDAAFRHASAFVLPSLSEGLPMTVLEAWSHSLPALITAACNLPEGAAAGAAIEAGPDATSLTGGLRRLLALSDTERRDMGARGRRLVADHFAWPTIARNMISVYQWLLGGGEPPSTVVKT